MTQTMWPPLNATLPDALTWTGDTDGRTWTTHGSELTMDYPDSPRVTLAAAILAAVGDGVQVYAFPPEVLVPPAVVITPADPYQAPATAAGALGAAWAFDINIILGRWKADQALDAMERAREVVTKSLPAGWRWVDFGDIGETIINKKAYLSGTLGVAVINTEGLG